MAVIATACGGSDDDVAAGSGDAPTVQVVDDTAEPEVAGVAETADDPSAEPTATAAPTPPPEPTATPNPTATPEPVEMITDLPDAAQERVIAICAEVEEALASGPEGSLRIGIETTVVLEVGELGRTLEPFGAVLRELLPETGSKMTPELTKVVAEMQVACDQLGATEAAAVAQAAVDPNCEMIIDAINAVGRVQDDQWWADYFSELSEGELDPLLERLRVGRNIQTGELSGAPVMGPNPDWEPAITELRDWREAWSEANC